jgi:hypothetical protein
MNLIDEIMKTTTKDLINMDICEISSLLSHLEEMKGKIELTRKGLEGIKNLKETKNVH